MTCLETHHSIEDVDGTPRTCTNVGMVATEGTKMMISMLVLTR